jgi:hypothetical protein
VRERGEEGEGSGVLKIVSIVVGREKSFWDGMNEGDGVIIN